MNKDEFMADIRRQLAEFADADGVRFAECRINKHAALTARVCSAAGFYKDDPESALASDAEIWFHNWDAIGHEAAAAVPGFSGGSSCMVVRPADAAAAEGPAWPVADNDDRRICDIFPRRFTYRFELEADDDLADHEAAVLNTMFVLYEKAVENTADWS